MRIEPTGDSKRGSGAGSGPAKRSKPGQTERFHAPDEIAAAEAMIEAHGRDSTLDAIEDIAARASLNIHPRPGKEPESQA